MKEKKIYFLFSKMTSNQSERVIYGQVVDYFLIHGNVFSTLMDISKYLIENKHLNFNPETIHQALNSTNHKEVFEKYSPEKDFNEAFRLKTSAFDTLSNYKNYLHLLEKYVQKFLGSKGYPKKRTDNIIEILLEVVFTRNIEYLRKLLTVKDEIELKDELKLNGKHNQFSRKDSQYYNELILESDSEFDEILRIVVLKMFDFLSLYYNPKHKETLNKTFNGKIYYLDSSFILRLLGFDNEFREERAIHLINILKQIEGIQFCVHRETLNEAQYRIKEIITKSANLLNKNDRVIKKITTYIPDRKSDIVELFHRLKAKGVVNNSKDFLLYYSNINSLLKRIFNSVSYSTVEEKIKVNNSKATQLYDQFKDTDKSKNRIQHIIRLICHIEKLRGANNYNPFEIKHWLITTDAKTLNLDHKISEAEENPIKSVCILPTELIRTIDGVGEVTGEHIKVFKKFILQSRVFKEEYTNEDVKTIEKIAALVESTDAKSHDTDTLIQNLLEKTSFDDIQKRLSLIEDERKQNELLVEMFNDANEEIIETKYSNLVSRIRTKAGKDARLIFVLLVYFVPSLTLLYLFSLIINRDLNIADPLTYINELNWGKAEGVFLIFEIIIWAFFVYVYNKQKENFQNWYTHRKVRKYKG